MTGIERDKLHSAIRTDHELPLMDKMTCRPCNRSALCTVVRLDFESGKPQSMNTDALIAKLSTDVEPVPGGAARTSLLKSIGCGGAIACLFVLRWLGLRPDLGSAVLTSLFWLKVSYTTSIATLGFVALERLSRPESDRMHWARLFRLPLGLLSIATTVKWMISPTGSGTSFWLGSSWWECPLYVIGLSAPVVAALLSALSRLAPARPGLAGAVAGLVGAATGATAYAFHCVETSPGFVLVWYSLGLAGASVAGALLGPRTLRW